MDASPGWRADATEKWGPDMARRGPGAAARTWGAAAPPPAERSLPLWVNMPGGALELQGVAVWRRALDRAATGALERTEAWLRRYWLLLFNVALVLLVGIAALARLIFAAYHLICAQIPAHSYFMWGHQAALCARNLAIFGSLLAGSLAFRKVRAWLPSLDWRLWVVTMVPMAWDGGTQLFVWRESTWELRTLTGALFGLGVCWFALPLLDAVAHGGEPVRLVLDLHSWRALLHRRQPAASA